MKEKEFKKKRLLAFIYGIKTILSITLFFLLIKLGINIPDELFTNKIMFVLLSCITFWLFYAKMSWDLIPKVAMTWKQQQKVDKK